MDIITMTPTAALRSRSESPFVVPSVYAPAAVAAMGVPAVWHLRAPMNDRHSTVRNTRTTAKQAAPPRGEPR